MDELLYNYLYSYYNTLSYTGYVKDTTVYKLLIYTFYIDLVRHDYRCHLSKEDYKMIEDILDCFYGTDCLIPYPDYLKMGKLHLGEITEMACRLRSLEDTNVVKVMGEVGDGIPTDVKIVFDPDEGNTEELTVTEES